ITWPVSETRKRPRPKASSSSAPTEPSSSPARTARPPAPQLRSSEDVEMATINLQQPAVSIGANLTPAASTAGQPWLNSLRAGWALRQAGEIRAAEDLKWLRP